VNDFDLFDLIMLIVYMKFAMMIASAATPEDPRIRDRRGPVKPIEEIPARNGNGPTTSTAVRG